MSKTIEFRYGLLYPSIEAQANEQGYTLGNKADVFEKSKKAIYHLEFGDILTDSQVTKAFQRLHKHVIKGLIPLAGEGGKKTDDQAT